MNGKDDTESSPTGRLIDRIVPRRTDLKMAEITCS
jgi:hypothetical protein